MSSLKSFLLLHYTILLEVSKVFNAKNIVFSIKKSVLRILFLWKRKVVSTQKILKILTGFSSAERAETTYAKRRRNCGEEYARTALESYIE